jgi:hypothetical protein
MDILICVFAGMILFFTVTAMCAFAGEGDLGNKIAFKLLLLNLALGGLLTLTICAINSQINDPANITKISCPIQAAFNSAFYVDENGNPHEIGGDAKFANPATSEMVITKTKGGWKWGIYVTEGRKVSLEKKVLPEAQK